MRGVGGGGATVGVTQVRGGVGRCATGGVIY